MDKQRLKELQSKQIMNMAAVYRKCGLKAPEVGTRLGRIRSSVPDKWLRDIKEALMDQIAEVVDTFGIPLEELIPKLLATLDTHFEQKKVFENMETLAVDPIAYIETDTKRILAIYLPEDQYRPRNSKYNSVSRFMTIQMLFERGDENFKLTERGRKHTLQKTKRRYEGEPE